MCEKRRLERYNLSMSTLVRHCGGDEADAVLVVETRDVCAGGAFFVTRSRLPEGTQVRVEMVLPTERFHTAACRDRDVCIRVDGTVLRSDGAGMAVRFDDNYRFCPIDSYFPDNATISGRAVARAN